MIAVLPNGYLTILEAAEVLSRTIYAGVPDLPIVSELWKNGLDVRDGQATDRAIAELWKAVDKGMLRALVIGGRPRRILRLSPELTKVIPFLRSPRGRGFTFLRSSNPAHSQLASWFGQSFYEAELAFEGTEVEKLARKLMRVRRVAQKADGKKKPRGRPSRIALLQPVIGQPSASCRRYPDIGSG